MQNFYTAAITVDGVPWRGETFDNVKFSLYRLQGGYHKKTEDEYLQLIKGWEPGDQINEAKTMGAGDKGFEKSLAKDFVDCELFTFDEIVAMRDYFRRDEDTKNGRFEAKLFLDYPVENLMPIGLIGVGGGDEEIDFNSQKELGFSLIGHCSFHDGHAKLREEKQEAVSIPDEIRDVISDLSPSNTVLGTLVADWAKNEVSDKRFLADLLDFTDGLNHIRDVLVNWEEKNRDDDDLPF